MPLMLGTLNVRCRPARKSVKYSLWELLVGDVITESYFLQLINFSSVSLRGRRTREACDGWLSGKTQMFHQELSQAAFICILVRTRQFRLRPLTLVHTSRYISDSRLVDSGGRVKVMTRMVTSGESSQTALSILSIENVILEDIGNYTCRPASGGQASIRLHVLEGGLLCSYDSLAE